MKSLLTSGCLCACLLCACETKTQSGALGGAAVGALAGGLIGGGEGAVIGGAAGAVGGALIGYALDEHDRAVMAERSPGTLNRIDNGEQLSIDDIEEMAQNGLSDTAIINQIKATGSVFYLSQPQVSDLKAHGVSNPVIDYMLSTGRR